jgi:hypothetical protein
VSKNPSKIAYGKPYFSGILEKEFEVSENITFLTPLLLPIQLNLCCIGHYS